MRVFVTGATGFIGSAIVPELIGAGHQVLGLTRSEEGAASLVAAGAEVHRGDLKDLDSLRRGAAMADGVIHLAFIHEFADWAANCEIDRLAIEALGDGLAGTDRPLIVTSGTALLPPGGAGTEDMPAPPTEAAPRMSEQAADMAGRQGARAMIVRLPPSVHGDGDHGFVPMLGGVAREKGASAYVGDGGNRWPAVHRLDAAHLYRLVLEKGEPGGRYHAIAEEGVAFRDIAGVIGRRLDMPVVSKSVDEAAGHFGWFAHFAAKDMPASSRRTRDYLGWQPTQPGLIADIDRANYFQA